MEWVETTAETIELAKNLALDQLGVAEDDAEFEVVEEPKQGLFVAHEVKHGCVHECAQIPHAAKTNAVIVGRSEHHALPAKGTTRAEAQSRDPTDQSVNHAHPARNVPLAQTCPL